MHLCPGFPVSRWAVPAGALLPNLLCAKPHQIQQTVQPNTGNTALRIFLHNGCGVKCHTQAGNTNHWQIIGPIADRNGLLEADVLDLGNGSQNFGLFLAIDNISFQTKDL